MKLSHLVVSTVGRMPLFADESARRRGVRALSRVAGSELVLFYFVDDHLHAVPRAERARAGRIAQALQLALAGVVAAPLATTHIQPVTTRSHLNRLLRYVLTQGAHHGLEQHPALWTGSCDLRRLPAALDTNLTRV